MLVCFPMRHIIIQTLGNSLRSLKSIKLSMLKKKIQKNKKNCVFTGYCSDAIYQVPCPWLLLPFMNSKRDFYAVGEAFADDMAQYDKRGKKKKNNHFTRVIICQPLWKSKSNSDPVLSVRAVGSSRDRAFVTATGSWLEGESEDRLGMRGWRRRGRVRFQISKNLTCPTAVAAEAVAGSLAVVWPMTSSRSEGGHQVQHVVAFTV